MRRLTTEGLTAFRRCPRKFHIEARLGYRPRSVGNDSVDSVVRRFARDVWGGRDPDAGEMGTGDPYGDASALAISCAFKSHFDAFPLAVRSIDVPYESTIVNPRTGAPTQTFVLAGVAPALVEHDGGIWALDVRVTGSDLSPGGTLWQRLRLGTSTMAMVLGLRGSGCNVRGVILDLVRRPGLRPKMATPEHERKYVVDRKTKAERLDARQRDRDETPAEFGRRIFDDISERPDFYVTRASFEWLAKEVEEAAYDLWASARGIRENELSDRWPRNPEACEQRGRLCPYFDVCRGVDGLGNTLRYERNPEHAGDESGEH